MSQLAQDLDADLASAKEAVDKGDVIRGLRLIGGMALELVGMITLAIAAMKVLTVVTGGIAMLGLPWLANGIVHMVRMYAPRIAQHYTSLSREERKQVRAALKFLGMGADAFL